jgi:hypothetical protein
MSGPVARDADAGAEQTARMAIKVNLGSELGVERRQRLKVRAVLSTVVSANGAVGFPVRSSST